MTRADRVHSTPPTNTSANNPPGAMTGDDELGIAWWNSLSERERAKWSALAGNTGRVKDAWEAFKRGSVDQSPPVDQARRRFLTVAAGASAASVGTLAVAAAMPIAAPASPIREFVAIPADPIYAAIERHKQTAALWEAAVDVRSNFHDLDMTTGQRRQCKDLNEAVEGAWKSCERAGLDLINTAPTTLAGIITAIEYVRFQMRDDGTQMPHCLTLETGGDAQDTMGWIDAFLDTIVNAAAALGKAVRS